MAEITLEKIDILRERAGITYREAYRLLEETGGDVVAALIRLEEERQRDSWQERIQVQGEELVQKVKEIIREGNVRRITVKNEEGKTLLEIPVTIGALGALLLPTLAALGVIAALVTQSTIVVERREPTEDAGTGRRVPIDEDHLDDTSR